MPECSLQVLLPELHAAGIIQLYQKYVCRERLQPLTGFFHDPHGIHGLGHTKRVLLLSLVLSYLNKLGQQDREILIYSSLYHDIGRTNDGICEIHGKQSIIKIKNFGLGNDWGPEDKKIIFFLIENHCISDSKALQRLDKDTAVDSERVRYLFEIFKDSDALDRWRINDLDTRYLRNKYSCQLVSLAYDLWYSWGDFDKQISSSTD